MSLKILVTTKFIVVHINIWKQIKKNIYIISLKSNYKFTIVNPIMTLSIEQEVLCKGSKIAKEIKKSTI